MGVWIKAALEAETRGTVQRRKCHSYTFCFVEGQGERKDFLNCFLLPLATVLPRNTFTHKSIKFIPFIYIRRFAKTEFHILISTHYFPTCLNTFYSEMILKSIYFLFLGVKNNNCHGDYIGNELCSAFMLKFSSIADLNDQNMNFCTVK